MKYFLKNHNPAYDFLVVSYLKDGGIDMKEIPWARARFRLQLYDARKESLTRVQEVFSVYAREWVNRRSLRPAFYDVFWHIFGHIPNLAEVREQESKLPKGNGKLLFSAEEIAKDALEFYRKFIEKSLRGDISSDAPGRISRYLTSDEWSEARRVGVDSKGIHREEHRFAEALLAWCNTMTPVSVLRDMEGVLAQHYDAPPHMKLDRYLLSHEGKKVERCQHTSQYLKLDAAHDLDDGHSSAHLSPIRGQAQVREGWLDVDFPWYYILTEE
jgi:hypothetical protein